MNSGDRGAVNDKKFVCKKCRRAVAKSREGTHKVDPMCTLRAYHLKMADKDWQHIDPRMEADFIAHGIIMARGPYSMDWSRPRHAGPRVVNSAWAPSEVISIYETRNESAHAKAAWEAVKLNPKFRKF